MKTFLFRVLIFVIVTVTFFSSAALAQKDVSKIQNSVKPASLSAMEQAVLDEINTVRQYPKKFIAYLEDYKKLFKGKIAYLPGNVTFVSNEGTVPIDETINELKKLPKLEPFKVSNGLTRAAKLQLSDLMQDSSLAHTGKNGSSLTQRVTKFGKGGSSYAENIVYQADTARDILLIMIIDDGLKSRNHRKNILSQNFKLIGIAFGRGKNGEGLCVAVFANIFNEANQKPAVRQIQ